MRRRNLLHLTLFATALGKSLFSAGPTNASPVPESGLVDLLIAAAPDRASATIVGEAALKEWTGQTGLDEIAAILARHLDIGNDMTMRASPGAIHKQVRRRTQEDFRLGRTLTIRGWVLAETEAQLCMLTALSASTPTTTR